MLKSTDTADRVRPQMHLSKNLVVVAVSKEPTHARPARLRFACADIRGLDEEISVRYHDAGEVIDFWTQDTVPAR